MSPATKQAVSALALIGGILSATGGQAQDKPGGVEEIIVTAQRREESAQRAALAIQAISSEEMTRAGVSRPEDLNKIATGIQIGTGSVTPQVYLRGVGNYGFNLYSEGAVAMNIDGVYVSRGWATRGAFFDLDRIEVLKGPQGTLYGRNASGGAVNLISTRPTFDRVSGYVEGEAGNFDLFRGAAAVNIPINDVLAVRAAGQAIHRDGYNDDGYSDDKSQAARLHVLYRPNTDFSLLLTGGYQHLGGKGPGWSPLPVFKDTSPWIGLSSPQSNQINTDFANLTGLSAFGSVIELAQDGFVDVDVYSISGELNWNFGPATLTVIPSYRQATNSSRSYVTSLQINYDEFDVQTGIEARLSNQTENLKWVVGAFYSDERQGNIDGKLVTWEDGGLTFGGAQGPFKLRSTSAAGFGQITASISPSFRVTAGLRYTYEHKKQDGAETTYITPLSAPNVCDAFTFDNLLTQLHFGCRNEFGGSVDFYNVSYKAGIEYDLAPQSLLYANYSTGFKSGGFIFASGPNYRPERLLAWELGVKNRFLNNRLQANIEFFYWRYLNHQEGHLGFSETGNITALTENAGVGRSYGVAVDFVYQPTRNDRFSLGVQWNPTQYRDFKYSYPTAAAGGFPPLTNCIAGPLQANGSQDVDCKGLPIVRAPIWIGNAGYEHNFNLGNGAIVTANVDAQFATGSYLGIEFLQIERQQAYWTLDASLTYTAPNGKWSVAAWGRNLTNTVVFNDAFPSPFVPGAAAGSIRPPRTYGIRARLNF